MLLDEFVGQEEIIETLKIYTNIAKEDKKVLDHTLIYGMPGHGKTMLANIIGELMEQEVVILNAGNIKTKNDLLAVITNLDNQILFLDEIHQLPIDICEELYSILQDNKMHVLIGEGLNKKTYTLDVDPFTLIGATTIPEALIKPLYDRLAIKIKVREYTKEELIKIINNHLVVKTNDQVALLIAKSGSYTPRIIINLCKRINDLVRYYKFDLLNSQNIKVVFKHLNISIWGYDQDVMEVMKVLYYDFNNEYVGETSLINYLTINKKTYLESVEPFMLKEQLLIKNKLGRKLTNKAISALKSE